MLSGKRTAALIVVLAAALAPVCSFAGEKPARKDRHGDPLPKGAIGRLGTTRLRHGGLVAFVKFLPDGKRLVSMGLDWTVRVWDLPAGKEAYHFDVLDPAAKKDVFTAFFPTPRAALSADGKVLAVIAPGKGIRLWRLADGKELPPIKDRTAEFTALALSPDGKRLAARMNKNAVRLWNLEAGKPALKRTIPFGAEGTPFGDGPNVLDFSPDGKRLGGTVTQIVLNKLVTSYRLWDPATGKEVCTLEPDLNIARPVFSPDSKYLAWVTYFDFPAGVFRMADAASGKVTREIRFDKAGLEALIFTPDGKRLIAQDWDWPLLHVWDVAAGKQLRQINCWPAVMGPPASAAPGPLAVSPDGKTVACAWRSYAVRLFDLGTGKQRREAAGHIGGIACLSFSPGGKQIVSAGTDRVVRTWEATGRPTGQAAMPEINDSFALSPDGRTLATLNRDIGTIYLCDAATGKEKLRIEDGRNAAAMFAFSPDGRGGVTPPLLAVRGQYDQVIRLYDAATGKERGAITVPGFTRQPTGGTAAAKAFVVPFVAFSPDGARLASPGGDGGLRVWDIATRREVRRLPMPEGRLVWHCAFSPDGRMLAMDLGEGDVSVWELASGKRRRRLRDDKGVKGFRFGPLEGKTHQPIFGGNAAASPTVAFSPDGRLLATTAGGAHSAVVWDVRAGKVLGRLTGHQGPVTALAFAPDGKTLVTGGADTTALVWDVTRFPKADARELRPEELPKLWDELKSKDAAAAFDAVNRLAAAPGQAVPLLKKHLRPAPPPDAERLARLIAELDSSRFPARQKARQALEKLGPVAMPALRKALADKPSLEARRRIEELLDRMSAQRLSGEQLRFVRAVEALERIGGDEARRLLRELAEGAPGAVETAEARAALRRLPQSRKRLEGP